MSQVPSGSIHNFATGEVVEGGSTLPTSLNPAFEVLRVAHNDTDVKVNDRYTKAEILNMLTNITGGLSTGFVTAATLPVGPVSNGQVIYLTANYTAGAVTYLAGRAYMYLAGVWAQLLSDKDGTAVVISITDSGNLYTAINVEDALQEIALRPVNAMSRQAVINGNIDVWQRGTSFTNPAHGAYTSDRYRTSISAGGATFPNVTHAQQKLTPGDIVGSFNYYRVSVDGVGSGYGTSSAYAVMQRIESGVRFLCGAGKKVTISFWARSSIAGKRIGFGLTQFYGTGGAPTGGETLPGSTFTLTSTWTKYTFTFTTNTIVGKTFGTNNDDFLELVLFYVWGTGTTYIPNPTAESFIAAGSIDVAQVQVNAGDRALPFQPRSFAEELALCQRYYAKTFSHNTAPVNGTGLSAGPLSAQSQTSVFDPGIMWLFPVPMRITPTITLYNPRTGGTAGQWTNGTVDGANARSYNTSEKNTYIDNGDAALATAAWVIHATADAEI